MTTGKTEHKIGDVIGTAKIVYGGRVTRPPMEDDRDPGEIELERLEREVIEAAKAELAAEIRREGDDGIDRLIATTKARRKAVNALLSFEAKQSK